MRNEAKTINKDFNKKIKEKRKQKISLKKEDWSIGLALSIVNGPEITNKEKEKALSNIEKEIEAISNMSLWEYLNHLKEKEKDKEKEEKDKKMMKNQ